MLETARLDVTPRAGWCLSMRIRETFEDEGVAFSGPVEVDETYMGDKEKNSTGPKNSRPGAEPWARLPW